MTTTWDEVPGARERPSGCLVKIAQKDNGAFVLSLPSRGVSPIVLFFAAVLLANLLVTLYTGLILLLTHRSILFMAQISPSGLPVSLHGWEGQILALLLCAEALGFFTLAAILRPLGVREQLEINREWLRVHHWEWGRVRERQIARPDVRGFLLKRIPPGLDAGKLTIQGRGEEIEVGEFLREADREWLVSVGNALLG